MAIELGSHIQRDTTVEAHRQAVERVIQVMRSRLGEPLTLLEMANIAHLSPAHFTRVFHQVTGVPPTQFLCALRLEAAKELLLTTSGSVTDICFEVGYNSLGTFTYRFTQLVGLSPIRFRQMAQLLVVSSLEAMLQKEVMKVSSPPIQRCGGRIHCATSFNGIIFVGLFSDRIPQGCPVGGSVLIELGPYYVGPLREGRYYTLAAGLPHSNESIKYWLPDRASVLVGASLNPILVRDGMAMGQRDLTLRPMAVTDPPLLVALPALFARNVDVKT
jgi:AraC family transcriptional regulator